MEITITGPRAMHALTSFAWERRKAGRHGCIGSLSRIRISGCLP
jgi:hypothetical protein